MPRIKGTVSVDKLKETKSWGVVSMAEVWGIHGEA